MKPELYFSINNPAVLKLAAAVVDVDFKPTFQFINANGEVLIAISSAGHVSIPQGAMTEAARLFWECVNQIGRMQLDLTAHLRRQRTWSDLTFGPGERTAGVIDHIRKELLEVEAAPYDTSEWIDVAILAFDGAMRAGATPEQVVAALKAKQDRNEGRTWPDWRTMPKDQAIEHDRSGEVHADGTAAPASRGCIWPDCGHDTNRVGYGADGCQGIGCHKHGEVKA